MPDIFDQVAAKVGPQVAPQAYGRTTGDIFDKVSDASNSIGLTDVLKSAGQGLLGLVGGLAPAFNSDPTSFAAQQAVESGRRAANAMGNTPGTAGMVRAAVGAVPIVGPSAADIAAPSLAYASGRPPSKRENLDAIRSGTATAAGLAIPAVAGRVAAARTTTPAPTPPSEPTTSDPTPFYGDEAARGPLDTAPSKPPTPPPTRLQQAANAVKTVASAVRHPVLTGATKAAEIVANKLSPPSATTPLVPPPANPAVVDSLQLTEPPPETAPTPPSATPSPSQVATAQQAIARQTAAIRRPPLSLDESGIPPSQMQSTSAITPTAPPTSIPTSSRQIALENAINDYEPPTVSRIPAPRSITRKTAQLEIGGEPVGKRVPYANQLPDPTSTMEAARIKAEAQLQRQLATSAIAKSTMQSKSFPQWTAADQQEFGRALNSGDVGKAAAVSSLADQHAAGIADPSFGAVYHLPDNAVIEAYRGNGVYIDPDGKITQIDPASWDTEEEQP